MRCINCKTLCAICQMEIEPHVVEIALAVLTRIDDRHMSIHPRMMLHVSPLSRSETIVGHGHDGHKDCSNHREMYF